MIRSFFNVIPLTRNDIILFKYSQSMRVSLNGMQEICVCHLAHRESALHSYNSTLQKMYAERNGNAKCFKLALKCSLIHFAYTHIVDPTLIFFCHSNLFQLQNEMIESQCVIELCFFDICNVHM